MSETKKTAGKARESVTTQETKETLDMQEAKETLDMQEAKELPTTQEDENIRLYRKFENKTMVYIGPDIPGAKQYTTYNAGLPDALKEKMKEHPFFISLVVPVERLAKASAELAKDGSALNILYQKASTLRKK